MTVHAEASGLVLECIPTILVGEDINCTVEVIGGESVSAEVIGVSTWTLGGMKRNVIVLPKCMSYEFRYSSTPWNVGCEK